jgi:hypothetical protein
VIWVLDASVPVKCFVEHIVQQPRRFLVPSLVWYELTHVLPRLTRVATTFDWLGRVMYLGIPCTCNHATVPAGVPRLTTVASIVPATPVVRERGVRAA